MKFKIEIDSEGCIACATCYTLDPIHFEAYAEGKSIVVVGSSIVISEGSFDDDLLNEAQEAELSCPVSVIKVTTMPKE